MKKFLKKCKKEIFLFLSANLIWAGIGICLAFILQYITDTALQNITGRILQIAIMAALYLVFDTIFEFASSYTEILLRTRLSQLLRNEIVCRIQKCSIEEKEQMGNAHYLSILNNNVASVETEYVHGILMVIFQIFSLVFALIATTLIQPVMTVVVISLCIIPLIIPKLLKNKLEKRNRETLFAKGKYLDFLNEFMEGFQTIKVFGREPEINRYHKKINEETTDKIQYNFKWKRISMSLSYGMGNFVVIGAWVFGAAFALNNSISIPQLIALTTLMNMVAGPFQIISEYYAGIISGRAIAKDLMSFINSKSADSEYKSNEANVCMIELKDVSVNKNNNYILNNIQIKLEKGQKIGIIGSSGSGKSTLLKVVAGILQAQEGNILLNGSLLPNNERLTHRDLLYLAQKTDVFSATIYENIALFQNLTDDDVEKAIHKAGLTTWFKRLGSNLHVSFDKSSINLSGGELKRVDFARSLLEQATIILFDEPTAGLDKFHSRSIMEQICSMEDRIIVVATHDLDEENICRFDYIYILEDGRIVEHDYPQSILNNSVYLALRQGENDK